MTQVTIQSLAKLQGVSADKLLKRLEEAGIKSKGKDDLLNEEEKLRLLAFLGGDKPRTKTVRKPLALKKKTTTEIKQTTRTGASRTVGIEVKKQQHRPVKSAVADTEKTDAIAKLETERIQRAQEAKINAQDESEKRQQEKERKEQEKAAAKLLEPATPQEDPITSPPSELVKPSEQADPKPSSEVDTDAKRTNKKRKGKTAADREAPKRAELHITNKRNLKARRKPMRKPSRISSTIAEAHAFAKPLAPVKREVEIPITISVGELAQAMSIKASEVIKTIMDAGSMVTINQLLDQDTAVLIVEEMGHAAKIKVDNDPEALLLVHEHDESELRPRPPVVTVMGHVDHGKTSLLDYIRKTKVASGESGGITQHIGAYKVQLDKGAICFLDTPGHKAFSAMRIRGANTTDVIVLVVAADDGVKPQTIEAISHARAAKVPIVVAINKIDRENANVDKVKQELLTYELVAEELGGDVLMNEVSAVTGQGVDKLLDSILLQAELLELKARYSGPARGQVVEARLDKGRGAIATVLVQEGILHKGDVILAGRESGRVRVLFDEQGKLVDHAEPSTPVEIQGFSGIPAAGDVLFVINDDRKAREVALHRQGKYKEIKLAKQQTNKFENMFSKMEEGETKTLNVLIKADVHGSLEALSDAIEKMSNNEVKVKVVHGMAGGINESDVHLAITASAMIIGFNVRADTGARKLIGKEEIVVHYHNVIYEAIDTVEAAIVGLLDPVIKENKVGLVEVRDVFKMKKIGAIAGCYVLEGMVKRDLPVHILRDEVVIFEGAISSLRRFKEDVREVKNGMECGISIKDYNDIKVGDQLEVYEIIETVQQR